MEQREMPVMGQTKQPEMAPEELVRSCKSGLDAIRLCIQLSSLSYGTISDRLGIDKGHWTRMMQGRAYFPTNKRQDLMSLCGNYAPLQWEAWKCGFELVERSKDQRIRELEAQLAVLRETA